MLKLNVNVNDEVKVRWLKCWGTVTMMCWTKDSLIIWYVCVLIGKFEIISHFSQKVLIAELFML